MELKDFTEKEQEQIEKGLSEAVLNDREAGEKNFGRLSLRFLKKRCRSIRFGKGLEIRRKADTDGECLLSGRGKSRKKSYYKLSRAGEVADGQQFTEKK